MRNMPPVRRDWTPQGRVRRRVEDPAGRGTGHTQLPRWLWLGSHWSAALTLVRPAFWFGWSDMVTVLDSDLVRRVVSSSALQKAA